MYKMKKKLAILCALSLITCTSNQLVFAKTNTKTKSQVAYTTKVKKKAPTKKAPVKKAPAKAPAKTTNYQAIIDKLTSENKQLKGSVEQLKGQVTQLDQNLKNTNTNVQNNSKIIKNIDISDGITSFEKYAKITLSATNNEEYKVYCLGSASELKYDANGKFFHGLVSYTDKETIKNNIIVIKK